MIQRRLLSFVFILLFAFAQQQALVHPYVHLVSEEESSSQQNNSTSNKQSPVHSEICEKCIALAGITSAVGSQAHILLVSPATFERTTEFTQPLFSTTYFPYHSRAPPTLA